MNWNCFSLAYLNNGLQCFILTTKNLKLHVVKFAIMRGNCRKFADYASAWEEWETISYLHKMLFFCVYIFKDRETY